MDLGLQGKTALVLAASRGLGRAIAAELAAEGANVMVSSRNEDALATTAAEIHGATGAEVAHFTADVTKDQDIQRLVAQTAERFGGVDALVTNTGGPPAGTFEDFENEEWQRAFELTLLNVVRAVRAVLPYMRERDGGRIVNVASSSIKQPIEGLTLSNTFRAGIAGLAKTLSVELAPHGILVNTLGPGRISTDRSAGMDASQAEAQGVSVEEVRAEMSARIPLGRYGTPEALAKVAAFLVSPANTGVRKRKNLKDRVPCLPRRWLATRAFRAYHDLRGLRLAIA